MRPDERNSGTLTDKSGSITAGATAQTISTAKPRGYFLFQNISDTDMWLNFGAAAIADQPSISIPGGQKAGIVFETGFIPADYASVLCATTGMKFVAKETS